MKFPSSEAFCNHFVTEKNSVLAACTDCNHIFSNFSHSPCTYGSYRNAGYKRLQVTKWLQEMAGRKGGNGEKQEQEADVWPELPEHIKAAIKALVQTHKAEEE